LGNCTITIFKGVKKMPDRTDILRLQDSISYFFQNQGLLERAMTRLAYAKEMGLGPDAHMDALATLGDAVIDVVVLESLVRRGDADKGVISAKKMDLVNMSQLRRFAENLSLHGYVRWGKGEREQHIWTSGRVLAECMESLVGAVYLDGGVAAVTSVLSHIGFIE
jgi:ribonuclease-3